MSGQRILILVTVIAAVSSALILGALWGFFGRLGDRAEGFVLAAGGGALMLAAVLELIVPALAVTTLFETVIAVMLGRRPLPSSTISSTSIGAMKAAPGLFAAVTLRPGVPENIALGVALIGADYSEVGALAASIFLSNLPEAAGGAKRMREMGWRDSRVLGLWFGVALLLTAAAVAGNLLFRHAS